jgi:hypothetical protein
MPEHSVRITEPEDKRVLVKAHKRRRVIKVTASEDYYRIRLHDPKALKAKGYHFRTVPASRASGLSQEEKRAISDADGKVVMAYKGPRRKPSGAKPQAILLPRGD